MVDVYLKEFEKLKDEQISRASLRDSLFNVTMVLIGGGMTMAFSHPPDSLGLLLLIPVVGFVAGMTHVASDRRISKIGSYFRERLAPKIAAKRGMSQDDVFEWEAYIRSDRSRILRKLLQLGTNLLLYVGSGLFALGWYVFVVKAGPHLTVSDWLGVTGDVFLLFLVLWEIVRHADICSWGDAARWCGRVILRAALAVVAGGLVGYAVWRFGGPLLPDANSTWEMSRQVLPVTHLMAAAGTASLLVAAIAFAWRQ